MRTAFAALAIGFIWLVHGSSAARAEVSSLTGIGAVLPVVETLSEDAEYCGLSVNGLNGTVESALGASRLRIADTGVFLYVNVLTAYTATVDYCISSINVELVVPQTVRLNATHRRVLANLTLWEIGGVFGSAREQHREQVFGMVQNYARQFVAAWTKAQNGR